MPACSRMGAYLRVMQEGNVGTGDEVHVVFRPERSVMLSEMVEVIHDRTKAANLLRAPRLPDFWREIAQRDVRHS